MLRASLLIAAILAALIWFFPAADSGSLAVLYSGRIRPVAAYLTETGRQRELAWQESFVAPPQGELKHQIMKGDGIALLPTKWGDYAPLNALWIDTDNFTTFEDTAFFALKESRYDPERIASILGTNFSLRLERMFYEIPWLPLLIAGYAATLLFTSFLTPTLVFHAIILIARCYILGRPPVATMYDTLLFVPFITCLIAQFMSKIARSAASFGAILLLSLLYFSTLGSGLETLQPVLNSRFWLSVHVLMVVSSYGAFFLAGVLSHIYLLHPREKIFSPLIASLFIGEALLIAGTLLGGVWAAQSWGRFWDWDPKESWAFISICIYLIFIHAYTFGKLSKRGLAAGGIAGLAAITFTWYGVNFILGIGLHSYGFGSGGSSLYFTYLALEALFLGWVVFLEKKPLFR